MHEPSTGGADICTEGVFGTEGLANVTLVAGEVDHKLCCEQVIPLGQLARRALDDRREIVCPGLAQLSRDEIVALTVDEESQVHVDKSAQENRNNLLQMKFVGKPPKFVLPSKVTVA